MMCSSVYQSSGPNKLSWSLSGNTLHCINPKSESRDYHVTVLAEELAYNKSLKSFKMFIIDRPLDPDYKVGVVLIVAWCAIKTPPLSPAPSWRTSWDRK